MAFTPKMSPVDIIGYPEIMPRSPERSQSFLFMLPRCCHITSQDFSCGLISLACRRLLILVSNPAHTDRVHIKAGESNSSFFWWPGGPARGQQSQGGACSWKRHAGPWSVFRVHIIVIQTILTPIVLTFSLLHASIRSSSVFLTYMKTNW